MHNNKKVTRIECETAYPFDEEYQGPAVRRTGEIIGTGSSFRYGNTVTVIDLEDGKIKSIPIDKVKYLPDN